MVEGARGLRSVVDAFITPMFTTVMIGGNERMRAEG